MKKKWYVFLFIVCLSMVITQYSKGRKQDLLMLNNIEALANGENSHDGAKMVLVTDHGSEARCRGDRYVSISSYSVDCIGQGSLPCQAGTYQSVQDLGPCYSV